MEILPVGQGDAPSESGMVELYEACDQFPSLVLGGAGFSL